MISNDACATAVAAGTTGAAAAAGSGRPLMLERATADDEATAYVEAGDR